MPGFTKLVLILWFLFKHSRKIVFHTMLYMIFQYGWGPVIIQRISFGFEAILENNLLVFSYEHIGILIFWTQPLLTTGILRDKKIVDKILISPMMIHIITPSVDYNKLLKRLDTQLIELTNQKKVPKVVKQTKKKPVL